MWAPKTKWGQDQDCHCILKLLITEWMYIDVKIEEISPKSTLFPEHSW